MSGKLLPAQSPYTNTSQYTNTNTRPYENTNTSTIISSHHRASSCQRQVLAREVPQPWHPLLEPIQHVHWSVIMRLYSSDHHHYSIIIIWSSYKVINWTHPPCSVICDNEVEGVEMLESAFQIQPLCFQICEEHHEIYGLLHQGRECKNEIK